MIRETERERETPKKHASEFEYSIGIIFLVRVAFYAFDDALEEDNKK